MIEPSKTTLCVVVPCYCEQEVLPAIHASLQTLLDELVAAGKVGKESMVLYVDDGSTDGTWDEIMRLHAASPSRVRGVKLASNVGHQTALLAGMEAALEHADVVVTIDADLQDDVRAIEEMMASYHAGHDVVYGVRRSRATDAWFKRSTARLFYRLMGALGAKLVDNHADFRLLSRRAVQQLLRYRERNLFLRGMVPLMGYPSAVVYYDRAPRQAGHTKYPLSKMLSFAASGITSFSTKPISLLIGLGAVFVIIAIACFIYVLWRWWRGEIIAGWTSIMLSIWFVGGCIIMGLGIVGEYVAKIYIEVKDRPRYIIEQTTENEQERAE